MEPPRLAAPEGRLCGSCYPGVGDHTLMCDNCFRALHSQMAGAQPQPSSVQIDQLFERIVPKRQHAATPAHLLPRLEHVDPLVTSVLMYGPSGRGKSFQAAALFRRGIEFASANGTVPVTAAFQWRTAIGVLELLKSEFGKKTTTTGGSVANTLIEARMLHIEDIGTTNLVDDRKSDWAYGRLLDIIDTRHAAMMPTIATTNLSLPDLEQKVGARIVSRLVDDAIVEFVDGAQRRAPRSVGAA